MKRLIKWVLLNYGTAKVTRLVDHLKTLGFHYATQAGISLGIDDLEVPAVKPAFLLNAAQDIRHNELRYERGEITIIQRLEKALDIWNTTNDILKTEVIANFESIDIFNPLYMMAFSGARGNISQVRQLVGMRGLMADPQGQILDFPIQSNFRDGLTVTEYMISCYGARKGLVDTALRTASSGYLTRRLVDVAQNVIIQKLDCKPVEGLKMNPREVHGESQLLGRVLFTSAIDTLTGRIVGRKNQDISPQLLIRLMDCSEIVVRSPLTCRFNAVCQLCYGWNLAQQKLVQLGEAVGVLAAQSIGEPGTQLTMRTFHTGGVFAGEATEKIYAPHSGIIAYAVFPQGRKIKTRYGEIAFLTYESVQMLLTREHQSSIFEFPPLTFLYVFPGDDILFRQSIAELTRPADFTSVDMDIAMPRMTKKAAELARAQSSPTSIPIIAPEDGQIALIGLNERLNFFSKLVNYNPELLVGQKVFPSKKLHYAEFNKVLNNEILSEKEDYLNKGDQLAVLGLEEQYKPHSLPYDYDLMTRMWLLTGKLAEYPTLKRGDFLQKAFHPFVVQTTLPLVSSFSTKVNRSQFSFLTEVNKSINKEKKSLDQTFIIAHSYKSDTTQTNVNHYYSSLGIKEKKKQFLWNSLNSQKNCIQRICHVQYCTFLNKRKKTKKNLRSNLIFAGVYFSTKPFNSFISIAKKETKPFWNALTFKNSFINLSSTQIEWKSRFPISINKYKSGQFSKIFVLGNPIKSILFKKISQNPFDAESCSQVFTFIMNPFFEKRTLQKTRLFPSAANMSLWKNHLLINTAFSLNEGEIRVPSSMDTVPFIVANYESAKNSLMVGAKQQHCLNVSKIKNVPELGIIFQVEDSVDKNFIIPCSGQVISIRKNYLLIRRIHTYKLPGAQPQLYEYQPPFTIWGSNALTPLDPDALNMQPFVIDRQVVEATMVLARVGSKAANSGDIVQGLPKVDEILEAREPYEKMRTMTSLHAQLANLFFEYSKIYGPNEACKFSFGIIRRLIVEKVQEVYRSQGVFISDKHVEIIARQMTTKVVVYDPANSNLYSGDIVELRRLEQLKTKDANLQNIKYHPILLGITRASLISDSFVSAASFQETKRVLTRAALESRTDWLLGLKENVVLGRLIPAGTGFYAPDSDFRLK